MIKDYLERIAETLKQVDEAPLLEIARHIIDTKKEGAAIFTAGNGGSAATASHFCNDLIKGCRVENRTGFKAMCLCDPMPVLTCLSNDFSYEEALTVQLQTHARPGDVLIVFSGSGNSPNILHTAKFARSMGMYVIGIGGRDGGKMKDLCDISAIAPTWSMEELEDIHLCYCHALVTYIREELKDMWDIEVVNYPVLDKKDKKDKKEKNFRYALFDFDGTISLLREGWRGVMVSYFAEVLNSVSPGEQGIEETVADFVDLLTGKQTIFQCIRLDEEVQKRGGQAVDPKEYKAEYLRRLMERIKGRHDLPGEYLVPGAAQFLQALKLKGIKLYLASGTDEADVKAEAELLGVAQYFDGGIYGAKDSIVDCSKEVVIRQILDENKIDGSELISFGDGYVEIQLVKDIGGYSVAVATDEERRRGVNAWKRKRLLSAGADVVIPDFVDYKRLCNFIWGRA